MDGIAVLELIYRLKSTGTLVIATFHSVDKEFEFRKQLILKTMCRELDGIIVHGQEHGWLEIYHGIRMTVAGPIYRIGTVMLDLEQPQKVVSRCNKPVLSPREDYERIGDVGNVAFACGAVVEDTGEIKVYYGAADTCICMATANFNDLVNATLNKEET